MGTAGASYALAAAAETGAEPSLSYSPSTWRSPRYQRDLAVVGQRRRCAQMQVQVAMKEIPVARNLKAP